MSKNLIQSKHQRQTAIQRVRSMSNLQYLQKNMVQDNQTIDSPLQIKLIKMFGLDNYFLQKIVFKRKQQRYFIKQIQQKNTLIIQGPYEPPQDYTLQIQILQCNRSSVPVCKFKPIHPRNNTCIIFAHGNASDLSDSISYIHDICDKIRAQYIVFDYTGYGQSRKSQVGQEIICEDMQVVLAWALKDKKLCDIILWGFSLGTFPVTYCSSKYNIKATILQCPIASVCCLFQKKLHYNMKFKQDHFNNLQLIHKIKGKILIMHSLQDQVIPFQHANILMEKFIRENGKDNMQFLQISKINHNGLHKYISSPIPNRLQSQTFRFIKMNIAQAKLYSQKPIKNKGKQKLSVSMSTARLNKKKLSLYSQNNFKSRTTVQGQIQQKKLLKLLKIIQEGEIPKQNESALDAFVQIDDPYLYYNLLYIVQMKENNKHILVTVGTTQFQSLIKATDSQDFVSLTKRLGYDYILYQIGKNGEYIPKNGQYFRVSSDINAIYKKADLLISHGGAGTLLQNLHDNKLIIAVANDSLEGNHQVQIIQELSDQGYVKGFNSVSQFQNNFNQIQEWLKNGKVKEYGRPKESILNKIIFQEH